MWSRYGRRGLCSLTHHGLCQRPVQTTSAIDSRPSTGPYRSSVREAQTRRARARRPAADASILNWKPTDSILARSRSQTGQPVSQGAIPKEVVDEALVLLGALHGSCREGWTKPAAAARLREKRQTANLRQAGERPLPTRCVQEGARRASSQTRLPSTTLLH